MPDSCFSKKSRNRKYKNNCVNKEQADQDLRVSYHNNKVIFLYRIFKMFFLIVISLSLFLQGKHTNGFTLCCLLDYN